MLAEFCQPKTQIHGISVGSYDGNAAPRDFDDFRPWVCLLFIKPTFAALPSPLVASRPTNRKLAAQFCPRVIQLGAPSVVEEFTARLGRERNATIDRQAARFVDRSRSIEPELSLHAVSTSDRIYLRQDRRVLRNVCVVDCLQLLYEYIYGH